MKRASASPVVAVLFAAAFFWAGPVAEALPSPNLHPTVVRGASGQTLSEHGVNLFNGNLTQSISLGLTYPVSSRLSYGFTLHYNSNSWDFALGTDNAVAASPMAGANAGFGWSLSFGRLVHPGAPGNSYNQWIYVSPDGSPHPFYGSLHRGETSHVGVSYTRDSSYLRMVKEDAYRARVEGPDGVDRLFEADGAGGWRLVRIEDPFGNHMSIAYAADAWTVTDSHGRSHRVELVPDPTGAQPTLVSRLLLDAFNDKTAVYTLSYQTDSVKRPNADSSPATPDYASVSQLVRIEEPYDSVYELGYGSPRGLLATMKLPTGGTYEWTYRTYSFVQNGCATALPAFLWTNLGIGHRRMYERDGTLQGEWRYNPMTFDNSASEEVVQGGATCEMDHMRTQVLSPLQDRHNHYFSLNTVGPYRSEFALNMSRKYQSGSAFIASEVIDCDELGQNCFYLRRYLRGYQQDYAQDPAAFDFGNMNRRLRATRVLFFDDRTSTGALRYAGTVWSDFDGRGNYRTETTEGNFGAGDVRTTFTNFNPGAGTLFSNYQPLLPSQPWILGTWSEYRVTEGSDTFVNEYCFDPASGAELRMRARYDTAQRTARDVVVDRELDASGHVTGLRHYGADVQAVDTDDLCSLALPSEPQYWIRQGWQYGVKNFSEWVDPQTGSSVLVTLDQDIDPGSGLVGRSRDQSGIGTSYAYDEKGRLRWTMPDPGHGAWTRYLYYEAYGSDWNQGKRTFVRATEPGGTGELSLDRYYVDGFNRVEALQKKLPSGEFQTKIFRRNGMGWIRQEKHWGLAGSNGWITRKGYDPFGRVGVVLDADGSRTTYGYAGEHRESRTLQIAHGFHSYTGAIKEHLQESVEVFDRQGRVWRQERPAFSADGKLFPMESIASSYNARGQVISQTKNGERYGAINYFDGRGFLRLVDTVSGHESYSGFDALGHPRTSESAATNGWRGYLRTERDPAARVVRIWDNQAPYELLKEFEYATSNSGSDQKKGKLVRSVRYTDFSPYLPGVGTAAVRETFEYASQRGRLSKRTVRLQDDYGRNEHFETSFQYNDLGKVSEIDYPRAVAGSQFSLQHPNAPRSGPRAVGYEYDLGWLTKVKGVTAGNSEVWIEAIEYHPTGLTQRLRYGNDVETVTELDPAGLPRPSSFETQGARWQGTNSNADFQSGSFLYDSSGRLVKVGDHFLIPQSPWGSEPVAEPPSTSRWGLDPFGLRVASLQPAGGWDDFSYRTADDREFKKEESWVKTYRFVGSAGEVLLVHTRHSPNLWPGKFISTSISVPAAGSGVATENIRPFVPSVRSFRHAVLYHGITTDEQGYRRSID